MNTIAQTLKTLTLSLTLVYGVNSVSFAADATRGGKIVSTSQLMEILRDGGLPEGTQKGLSTEGNACELTISTKVGQEMLSMQSSVDEWDQRLIFNDSAVDDAYEVSELKSSTSIFQDLSDSTEEVTISKTSSDEVSVMFEQKGAGEDDRKLTCIFK
ncbi:hypothetical protein CIK05_03275 [Bdellovibrio sp. qaytius]|nr:hypothetical protein CIK05_03275 [Bdellovibrio sp. qaytius]